MEKVINVSPESSAEGLRQDLEVEARRRGRQLRAFIGDIYTYSVENRDSYLSQLSEVKSKPGSHIGAVVPEETKKKLDAWAKEQKTSRGRLCCYILEKTLEEDLLNKIFPAG